MSEAAGVLSELQRRGVILRAEGDTLCLKPRRALDDVLLARVQKAKPAILEALRNRPGIARKAIKQATLEREAIDTVYSDLARDAVQRIAEVCPPGALKWAREVHPTLTDRIDVEIIARLDDLWANHTSLAEFQAALDELVRLHGEVGTLFAKPVIEDEG